MSSIKNSPLLAPSQERTESPEFIVQIHQLFRRFSGSEDPENVAGLQDVSFDVRKGDVTAIIGESGSGKSTLLRAIYGLNKIDSGEVLFKGERVKGPDEKLIPGHESMRMVSQHFNDLNTYANVWDNVASRLSNHDLESKERLTRIMLERLRVLALKDHRIADLSGGEKQRVAIARALITSPDILLMDEPFNQLDSSFRDQLQSDIRQLVEETGLTVILVSHDPSEVMGLADFLILLKAGAISAKGDPYDLYQNPTNAYVAKILTKSNILSPQQAYSLGLKRQETALHPEWIKLKAAVQGDFKVERVIHRGFYDELVIRSENVVLRCYEMTRTEWDKGQLVELQVVRSVTL